jgi:hypothetical protein
MKQTFTCDHCGGHWGGGFDTAEKCKAHEATCDYNPASKACATCKHRDWPETKEQCEKWERWDDSEREYVADMGCLVFNDQVYRTNCEKWKSKKTPPAGC